RVPLAAIHLDPAATRRVPRHFIDSRHPEFLRKSFRESNTFWIANTRSGVNWGVNLGWKSGTVYHRELLFFQRFRVGAHVANVAVVGSTPITRSRLGRYHAAAAGLNSITAQRVQASSFSPPLPVSASVRLTTPRPGSWVCTNPVQ